MIVGLMADIHANLPALKAVLADAAGKPDLWICAGDIVGYYADPTAVCWELRRLEAQVIRGNHDEYATGLLAPPLARESHFRATWTRNALEPEALLWLSNLECEFSLKENNIVIKIYHASPWDRTTYIYPNSPLLDKISLEPGEWLVLGHTHYPMLDTCGAGWVVNPGAVGQPRDSDPRASYALFNTRTAEIEFRRVSYDIESLKKRLHSLSWPDSTIKALEKEK